MAPRMQSRRKAGILIILLLFLFSVGYLHQYLAFADVCRRIDAAADQVAKQIISVRKFQMNNNLETELARINRDLQMVDAKIPGRLDGEQFVDLIARAAKKHQLRIEKLQTVPGVFDFWQQLDVILLVSGADADRDAWLETVTAGNRRVDHYLAAGEAPVLKVILTVYATGVPEESNTGGDPADACRPLEHAVWLWPFPGRIEKYKSRLQALCSQQWQMQEAIATMLKFKREAKLLQKKLAVYREIEQRHERRRKADRL